jgi:hypothetical protein
VTTGGAAIANSKRTMVRNKNVNANDIAIYLLISVGMIGISATKGVKTQPRKEYFHNLLNIRAIIHSPYSLLISNIVINF